MNRKKRSASAEAMILNSQRKQTSHVVHLLLTVITGGLWMLIWLLVALSNSIENSRIDRRIRKLYQEDGADV